MRSIVSVMFVGGFFFSNALGRISGYEVSGTEATRLGDKNQEPVLYLFFPRSTSITIQNQSPNFDSYLLSLKRCPRAPKCVPFLSSLFFL